jgi:hypothetical protein
MGCELTFTPADLRVAVVEKLHFEKTERISPLLESAGGVIWGLGEHEVRERTFYLVGAPIAVVLSAAFAYALVFILPQVTGYDVYDYIGTYTAHSSRSTGPEWGYDYSVPDIQDLTKLQPEEFQAVISSLFDELVKLPEEQLYMLSALDTENVCRSKFLECLGVPGTYVKLFIEKALSHKQTRSTKEIAAGSLDTAKLSLAVAFAAFLVSVLGMLVKRRRKTRNQSMKKKGELAAG